MRVSVPGDEERERGLATVVGEEEFGVGGESAAPGPADGAAPEQGLHRQTRQDLPDNEILGERGAAAGYFLGKWIGNRRKDLPLAKFGCLVLEGKGKNYRQNFPPVYETITYTH
jgi:hypothetical protein